MLAEEIVRELGISILSDPRFVNPLNGFVKMFSSGLPISNKKREKMLAGVSEVVHMLIRVNQFAGCMADINIGLVEKANTIEIVIKNMGQPVFMDLDGNQSVIDQVEDTFEKVLIESTQEQGQIFRLIMNINSHLTLLPKN